MKKRVGSGVKCQGVGHQSERGRAASERRQGEQSNTVMRQLAFCRRDAIVRAPLTGT